MVMDCSTARLRPTAINLATGWNWAINSRWAKLRLMD
jgi:hypothetical protein